MGGWLATLYSVRAENTEAEPYSSGKAKIAMKLTMRACSPIRFGVLGRWVRVGPWVQFANLFNVVCISCHLAFPIRGFSIPGFIAASDNGCKSSYLAAFPCPLDQVAFPFTGE